MNVFLEKLSEQYPDDVICHLSKTPSGASLAETELLNRYQYPQSVENPILHPSLIDHRLLWRSVAAGATISEHLAPQNALCFYALNIF